LVEGGRPDLLLTVAAKLSVAEIVGEDKDNVGRPRYLGAERTVRTCG
jgi:hypothetical protein